VNHPEKLQNIRGVIFFLVASNAFGGIQGTLATFSTERPVFLRERFSKSYKTFTYFLARTGINFPFELVYPTVGAIIIYWATSLGLGTAEECFKLVAMVNGVYFCAASYGLLYAALIPKLETAMALVPVLIIPFMLLGGFFINLDNVTDIRVIFYPIMYLSPFKYGFQGGMDSVGIPSSI
jgi:ABC-type multidrug transport system permease subunit